MKEYSSGHEMITVIFCMPLAYSPLGKLISSIPVQDIFSHASQLPDCVSLCKVFF